MKTTSKVAGSFGPALPPLQAADDTGPPWLGSVHHRAQVDLVWLIVTLIMLVHGIVFFGRWALAEVAVTALATLAVFVLVGFLMRVMRPRAPGGDSLYALWLGLMLGLSTPLIDDVSMRVFGGALLGVAAQLVGRAHRFRAHPIAVTLAAMWLLPLLIYWPSPWISTGVYASNNAVLRPSHLVVGDIRNVAGSVSYEPWWRTGGPDRSDAVHRVNPYEALRLNQMEILDRPTWLVRMLSSGELPRMESLLLGATPGPIGASSPALVLFLGLFLVYRRLSSWPMALAALCGAVGTLLLMPVQLHEGWSMVMLRLGTLGPAAATTYLGYFLLCSPLVLIVMLHAPLTMPLTSPGRVIYGLLLGAVVVAIQWFVGVPEACFLGLVLVGLLGRTFDSLHRSPFLRD